MWHKAGKVSDVQEGKSQVLEIAGQGIAIFNVRGKFYAIQNTCPHRGGPLSEGHLEGNVVTCPWHAWQFDVTDGGCQTMPGTKQKTYPTKIEKDEVYIEV